MAAHPHLAGEFRRQCRLADAVVVRSHHEQQRVVRGLGIAAAKVHLVHLGIDTGAVDPARAAAGDREGILHLSAFGQERKNVLRLIAAAGPTGLPLTIAGACEPHELVRVQAAARPFANITIRGFLSAAERDELYYRSRVFALPSMNEGTGLAALEAGARGCGVVITRKGGPPDYFAEVGHLIEPRSVEDLRAKLMTAYRDSAPAQISAHITTRFNDRVCAERLLGSTRARARGAPWLLLANLFNRGLTIATQLLVGFLLVPEQVGVFAVAAGMAGIALAVPVRRPRPRRPAGPRRPARHRGADGSWLLTGAAVGWLVAVTAIPALGLGVAVAPLACLAALSFPRVLGNVRVALIAGAGRAAAVAAVSLARVGAQPVLVGSACWGPDCGAWCWARPRPRSVSLAVVLHLHPGPAPVTSGCRGRSCASCSRPWGCACWSAWS